MKDIENYFDTRLEIDGLPTFLISDNKLLEFLNHASIPNLFFKNYKEINKYNMHMGAIYYPKWLTHPYIPVELIMINGNYHHVSFKNSWRCRTCGYQTQAVVIHYSYEEYTLYHDNAEVLQIVKKDFPLTYCPICNHILQACPILLENK